MVIAIVSIFAKAMLFSCAFLYKAAFATDVVRVAVIIVFFYNVIRPSGARAAICTFFCVALSVCIMNPSAVFKIVVEVNVGVFKRNHYRSFCIAEVISTIRAVPVFDSSGLGAFCIITGNVLQGSVSFACGSINLNGLCCSALCAGINHFTVSLAGCKNLNNAIIPCVNCGGNVMVSARAYESVCELVCYELVYVSFCFRCVSAIAFGPMTVFIIGDFELVLLVNGCVSAIADVMVCFVIVNGICVMVYKTAIVTASTFKLMMMFINECCVKFMS